MHDHERSKAKHVLLVDDDDRLRGVLALYLGSRGHHVVEASTAGEARVALDHEQFDVLLLDINLSDDTGWSILRSIRERPNETAGLNHPCVVILAAIPPSPKRLEEFAPDAVLNKPFPIDALIRLVESECNSDVVAGFEQEKSMNRRACVESGRERRCESVRDQIPAKDRRWRQMMKATWARFTRWLLNPNVPRGFYFTRRDDGC
jgi:CheY-like chemotaxis protein